MEARSGLSINFSRVTSSVIVSSLPSRTSSIVTVKRSSGINPPHAVARDEDGHFGKVVPMDEVTHHEMAGERVADGTDALDDSCRRAVLVSVSRFAIDFDDARAAWKNFLFRHGESRWEGSAQSVSRSDRARLIRPLLCAP